MTKIKTLLIGLAALLLAGTTSQAQIAIPPITIGGTNVNLDINTNWVGTAYGIYDLTDKTWGYGGAVLYKVSDNFLTGVRAESINKQTVKAGVTATLQATVHLGTVADLTPFADASTGLGNNSLYGSIGSGAALNFKAWTFKVGPTAVSISAGLVLAYEHVVDSNTKKWNQAAGGPEINLLLGKW